MIKKGWLVGLSLSLVFLLVLQLFYLLKLEQKQINGLLLLSENTGDITGYYKWEKELDQKGLRAIIKPERAVLEKYPDYFKNLADKGYEIATGYGEAPFWGMSYQEQYEIMKEYKEFAEGVIGKPIKIFSSKYFAYDENTLRAADDLGISYILARGSGLKATVYAPKGYQAKLLSVSNLVFEEMGSGSLCDVSLYQRGSTAEDFQTTLTQTLNEDFQDLILVSHVYIGGTRAGWWDAYQFALDSEKVVWRDFDVWVTRVDEQVVPYDQIPYNTEVKYIEPKPAVPLDEIELIPDLKNEEKIIFFHNGRGQMCLDFLEFLRGVDYPIEEHLTDEADFYQNLENYRRPFDRSEGASEEFGYFPIIFVSDRVFSGFDEAIGEEILQIIRG